jgi:hypothetical protein
VDLLRKVSSAALFRFIFVIRYACISDEHEKSEEAATARAMCDDDPLPAARLVFICT